MAAPRDPDDERSDANLEEIEHDAPSPTIPPVEPQRIFPLTRDVAARGARVRFVEIGEGPPVLMIHGYLANHAAWDHLLDSFGKRFRTIAPDLPGFGDSEKPSPSRYAYNADAFADFAPRIDDGSAVGVARPTTAAAAASVATATTPALLAVAASAAERTFVAIRPSRFAPQLRFGGDVAVSVDVIFGWLGVEEKLLPRLLSVHVGDSLEAVIAVASTFVATQQRGSGKLAKKAVGSSS